MFTKIRKKKSQDVINKLDTLIKKIEDGPHHSNGNEHNIEKPVYIPHEKLTKCCSDDSSDEGAIIYLIPISENSEDSDSSEDFEHPDVPIIGVPVIVPPIIPVVGTTVGPAINMTTGPTIGPTVNTVAEPTIGMTNKFAAGTINGPVSHTSAGSVASTSIGFVPKENSILTNRMFPNISGTSQDLTTEVITTLNGHICTTKPINRINQVSGVNDKNILHWAAQMLNLGNIKDPFRIALTVDSSGNLWVVVQPTDGDPLVGSHTTIPRQNGQILLIKYDPSGQYLGSNYLYQKPMLAGKLSLASDGDNIILAFREGENVYQIDKRGPDMSLIWCVQLFSHVMVVLLSLGIGPQGGVWVTGYFQNDITFSSIGSDNPVSLEAQGESAFLAKYDARGHIVWTTRIGGISSSGILNGPILGLTQGVSLAVNHEDGSAYLAGFSNAELVVAYHANQKEPSEISFQSVDDNHQNIFLAKYDDAGRAVWITHLSPLSPEDGMDLAIDQQGQVLLTVLGRQSFIIYQVVRENIEVGMTIKNDQTPTVYLIKYNPQGKLLWFNRIELINDKNFSEAQMPQEEVLTPQAGVQTPQGEVRTPQAGVRTPQGEVRTPQAGVRTHYGLVVQGQEYYIALSSGSPQINIYLPNATIGPKIVNTDKQVIVIIKYNDQQVVWACKIIGPELHLVAPFLLGHDIGVASLVSGPQVEVYRADGGMETSIRLPHGPGHLIILKYLQYLQRIELPPPDEGSVPELEIILGLQGTSSVLIEPQNNALENIHGILLHGYGSRVLLARVSSRWNIKDINDSQIIYR